VRAVAKAGPVQDLGAGRDHPVIRAGTWSVLKRGVPANLAVASFGHLVQVIRHGPTKIQ